MAHTFVAGRRERTGKGPNRRLRSAGKIPGVIYGHGKETVQIELNARDFDKFLATLKSKTELVSLDLGDSAAAHLTLLKDLHYHPVSEKILHVDFYEINPNEAIHVQVPLHFVGTPVGVSEEGGMLEYLQRSLDVLCLPRHIPTSIDIDITGLGGNAALYVSDLTLPENVTTREDPKKALVHVTTKTQTEAPAVEGTVEPAGA
jgi:large subunit ribosomal protein L25